MSADFDRAAPHGTGHIKAGLNYAMSLHAIVDAHNKGFDENMYLDAATRTNVEETGGANFIFVTKDGKVVTPKSDSILPSITRRSLMYVAEHYLGLEVEEREVYIRRAERFRRVWSVRYSSRYLSGRKDRRSRQRDLLPERYGGDGTDHQRSCMIH